MWTFATRSRVENCKRFIQAWHDTEASSEVYVRLDNCDPELVEMRNLPWPETFTVNVGPRKRIGEAMQEMFAAYPNEPWYGILADDLVPRTRLWDKRLIEAAGTTGVSCAEDIHTYGHHICHPCVGGDLVRFVGFFGLPVVKHFGTDTFWQDVFYGCNMKSRLTDVIVEHVHYYWNKAPFDKTYQESELINEADRLAWKEWFDLNMSDTIAKIKERFGY